ncbi:MAG TPA: S8 family serine peptidase [Candidatus Binatia bacterium]|nr:S8 family serine peptidase [Candidatus Binatia bacterium]
MPASKIGFRPAEAASLRSVLVVLAAAAAVAVAAGRVSAAEGDADGLMAKAKANGSVRVIVRLDVAEAAHAGAAPLPTLRRAAIAASRAELARALPAGTWATAREYETLPYVALEVSPDALARLESSGVAQSIVEDRLETVQLPESGPLVQATDAAALGYDGSGWAVAILDTGVDGNHPFLAGKVIAEACFSANGSCPDGSTTQIGSGAAAPCGYAPRTCLHGTHVAGIAAGRGDAFSGIARGASIVAVQVFSRFTGRDNCADEGEDPCAKSFTSDTIAALDFVNSLRQTVPIAAVNLSLGGGRYFSQAACDLDNQARTEIVDALRAAGVATVAAAGNQSYTDSLTAPACETAVVSVGATTKSDAIASFSNSASFLSLLAPGTPILSSIPPDQFAYISGTSQATPHVTGAFAILYQRMGGASVDTALSALQSTGLSIFDPRNGLSKPRIRILDALNSLPSPGSPSGIQISPDVKHSLISKDVNGERWAIATNGGTASVTGNVFNPSGGSPTFLWCQRTGSDGNPDPYAEQISFSCSVAGNCNSAACPVGQWSFASNVTLPGSFFLPPAAGAASVAGGSAGASVASDGATAVALADVESALQISPDSAETLVSKDVNGERWAITRNADDGTVTGNVYAPGGGDPKFVWCSLAGTDGNPDPSLVHLTYNCSVADRCPGPTCAPDAWSFFSQVTLPGSFFLPR